jgi:hypothetical protein
LTIVYLTMNSVIFLLRRCAQVLAVLLLNACEIDRQPASPRNPDNQPGTYVPGEPTAVGQPSGEPASATIGPAGGELTSADGKLTLSVPPGALAQETTITVQPLENTAPNGSGTSYEIDGLDIQVSQPVITIYTPRPGEITSQSGGAVRVAVQDARRVWNLTGKATYDPASGKITARIRRLSKTAIAFIEQYKLVPENQRVLPGQVLEMHVMHHPSGFADVTNGDQDLVIPLGKPKLAPRHVVQNLLVNGSPLNFEYGTLQYAPDKPDAAVLHYTAPALMPVKSEDPVSLTVQLYNPAGKAYLALISRITIAPGGELRIDGRNYSNPLVHAFVAGQALYVEVNQRQRSEHPNHTMSGLSLGLNFYHGPGTYQLDEATLGDYSVSATVEDKPWGYFNWYLDENNNQHISPVSLTVSEERTNGKISVMRGTIEGVLYREGLQKSDAVRVFARFEVANPAK